MDEFCTGNNEVFFVVKRQNGTYVAFEVYLVFTPEGIVLDKRYCITCQRLLFSR